MAAKGRGEAGEANLFGMAAGKAWQHGHDVKTGQKGMAGHG